MGRTLTSTAEEIGVNRATVFRWTRQPAFVAELQRLSDEALERTMRRLTTLSEAAAMTLGKGMAEGQPIGARLRAASTVLDAVQRWIELVDILGRLEALERKANDGNT